MAPLHPSWRARRRGGSPIDTDEYALWDAAYVLGALPHAARREFQAHLSTCPRCRESVAELAGMPALLRLLTRGDVMGLGESGPQLPRPQSLMALWPRVRRGRFRTRLLRWACATVAAAVLKLGVLTAMNSHQATHTGAPPGAGAAALTMASVVPTSLSATVTLHQQPWGTRNEMTCTYGVERAHSGPNEGRAEDTLEMVVVGRDGHSTRVATWLARAGTTATPSASTPLSPDDIAAVQAVSADTAAVLLQRGL